MNRSIVSVFLALVMFLGGMFPQAHGQRTALLNAGAYSSGTAYAVSDVVTSGGIYYVSLVGSNTGHSPSSSPSQWAQLGSGGGGGGTITSVNGHTGPTVTVTAADVGAIANNSGAIISTLGYTPAQTPTLTGSIATNVIADYNFSQGSGTSLTDISGNGNSGTLGSGSAAPTWINNGLHFTYNTPEGVSLPSALNAGKTFVIGFYFNPVNTVPQGATVNTGGYGSFITSSLGSPGINFINDPPGGAGYGAPAVWNNSLVTSSLNFTSGFHVWAFVLGTGGGSVDQIYIDGTEVAYSAQGATAGAQSSGNLFFGTSAAGPWGTSAPEGTAYRMRVYSSQLGASDIQLLTQAFRADATSRGVPIIPFATPTAQTTLHCIGDSIQFGSGFTAPCSLLSLTNQPSYAVDQWGISGINLQALTASEDNRAALLCQNLNGGPNVALIEGGVNDINHGLSAQTIYQNFLAEILKMRHAGCTVGIMPILSNTFSESVKDSVNDLLRKNAIASGADFLADTAANPLLGADGACSNSSIFQPGCLHPNATGYGLMAAAMSNAMNYYFGSNPSSPSVVTATSYTMAAGDGYVQVNPSGNTTVTLPDCIGQSGAVYRINFADGAGSHTLSVLNAVSAEPINGTDHSSSALLALTGAGTVAFRDVPNPSAASGCHWDYSSF